MMGVESGVKACSHQECNKKIKNKSMEKGEVTLLIYTIYLIINILLTYSDGVGECLLGVLLRTIIVKSVSN